MCGIVGYNGKDKNTLHVLIDGLKALEYRGYDSAGIAYKNNEINIIKSVGKIDELEKKVDYNIKSNIGIGHTRWATHGSVNITNCHPHNVGDITIVHNGIIENFNSLKEELENKKYKFNTKTDTEVACALIDLFYNETKDIKKALVKFMDKVEGSYALGVIVKGDDNIYSVRKDSPLIVAKGDNGNFIASDTIAVSKYAGSVMYLKENIIAEISSDNITLFDRDLNIVENDFKEIDKSINNTDKCGYDYYMLKEIHEQPKVFRDTVSSYLENGIDSLIDKMPDFTKYNRIDIVACGSAYHTGLVGKNLIEEFADIPVNVEVASEYRYKKNFYDDKTLVIVVSQSGETADTLAALRKAKGDNIDTLAIVNVEGSTMAREANILLKIKAGREIAVATTKAYSAQVAMLSLIALNLASAKGNIDKNEIKDILKDIKELPVKLENTILNPEYEKIANAIYENESVFFIGRGIDYALSMEGSLKLKEISYINSQAYAAGELKHGTISLIDEGTPVIGILTEDNLVLKTISNMEEVKSRGAVTIGITNNNIDSNFDYKIEIPKVHKLLQPLLTVIPLQLISYEVAKLRKCNIDQPKNLAKSVTVE